MSRVLKHPLLGNPTSLPLPVGGRFLAFASVVEPAGELEYAWTEEPTDKRVDTTTWLIWVVMTGDHVPPGADKHLGTHVGRDRMGRPYVTHFYGSTV